MGNRNHPKDSRPGYRVGKGATNGPYGWGNGPQPKSGCCFAGQAVKAVWAGKFRLARRFLRLDLKHRLGVL